MTTIIFYLFRLVVFHCHHTLTVLHRRGHGILQSFQVNLIHNNLVDHDLDIVHLVPIHAHPDRDLSQLTVYTGRNKTVLPQILE